MSTMELVQSLADRLRAALDDDVLQRLADDPIGSIERDLGLGIEFRPESRRRDGCGVDGSYVPGSSKIVVARSVSTRRQNFTALHEAAHYLCFTDADVSDRVAMHSDVNLEETIANTFAADVLIPQGLTDQVFGEQGLTAAAVRELYEKTQASRSTCCAAAVRYLPARGYVILSDVDGEVFFAPGTPHQYVLSPGSQQPETSMIVLAAQNGHARGVDRLVYRTGNKTPEHNVDAVRDNDNGRWVFAVAVAGKADWPSSGILADRPEAHSSVECPNCEAEFQTWGSPCTGCGDYKCPRCKQCECKRRPDDARCPNCHTVVLPHLLVTGGCLNCS